MPILSFFHFLGIWHVTYQMKGYFAGNWIKSDFFHFWRFLCEKMPILLFFRFLGIWHVTYQMKGYFPGNWMVITKFGKFVLLARDLGKMHTHFFYLINMWKTLIFDVYKCLKWTLEAWTVVFWRTLSITGMLGWKFQWKLGGPGEHWVWPPPWGGPQGGPFFSKRPWRHFFRSNTPVFHSCPARCVVKC